MKPLFDRITRLSIRYKWLTIGIALFLMALGVYAALDLNIELVPSIDMPSTYILARSGGSTSSDVLLQVYTVPIEDGAGRIDGVVNRESNTTNGYVFLEIRNEFGLDQDEIRDELQQVINDLPLPTRTITPPDGMTPQTMIADLPPDVILYLYAYSLDENMRFLAPLTSEVWHSFSPDVINALPDDVFDQIDGPLATELLSQRQAAPQPLPDLATTPPPSLPPSWQMDRFETTADLIEITVTRDLAELFNDFVDDGTLTGPLGTVTDLTPQDIQTLVDFQTHCTETMQGNDAETPEDADRCAVFGYLDGEMVAALLSHFNADMDGAISESTQLPEDYFSILSAEDRNVVATTMIAQSLTGTTTPRNVELPDEWMLEKPVLITFSFSDIPLAVLSVSADLSRDELRHLVENEIVPRLEALDDVADVSIEGGESIRQDLLNEALVDEGLPPETDGEPSVDQEGSPEASSDSPDSGNEDMNDDSGAGGSPDVAPLEEGPALPPAWALFAGQLPGVDELDTADDLLRIPGMSPSMLLNQAVAMTAGTPASTIVAQAIADLSPEALYYLADHEPEFYANLSNPVLVLLADDTLAELPEAVQTRAASAATPPLGEFWQRLAAEPEMANSPLSTAADLAQFGDGAAATLNDIVTETPDALQFYAIQLVNDLSPNVLEYLIETDAQFAATLEAQVFCYFDPPALALNALQARWENQGWQCQFPNGTSATVEAIAAGDAPTAAQTILGVETSTRIHDPEAPLLPSNWSSVAGFVGAQELDTADDLFYTVKNGEVRTPSQRLNDFANPDGSPYLETLDADALLYIADCDWGELCEEDFFSLLSDRLLTYLNDETASGLPEDIQARRSTALLGTYVPEASVTRTNGDNSLLLNLRKEGEANTVAAWSDVEEVLDELEAQHPEIEFDVAFEQATYIEESISGVAREGGLGAVMAVVVILIFLNFSVRSTIVTAMSIPTSVALAFVLMRWLPANVHDVLLPLSEDSGGFIGGVLDFLLRLFPKDISLNIMTLSGLTVAIGRVVDDAIVVLENIYRNIQQGEDQLEAVLHGTRDVSVAIFAATITTVVVFLPIGLFGGIIGAFFLPFGLAVTYALIASFVVAITLVPLLAYIFINQESLPEEHESRMERGYRAIITWALSYRWAVMGLATLAFFVGVFVLTQLPTAFLPSFGEPTITVSISLPDEINGQATTIAVTDAKVRRLEEVLLQLDGVETVQTSVGGTGNGIAVSDTVAENEATITIAVESQERLEELTPQVRAEAERIFNDLDRDGAVDAQQSNVKVSGASLSEQGFGGFAVVISGDPDNPPTLEELKAYDAKVLDTLEGIEGITNAESSLSRITGSDSETYIRIDGIPAARYTAELETDDTLGLTQESIDAVKELDLPENLIVSEGFESQQQTEGFQQTFISMGIAVLIVYLVMVLTFGSMLHPVTILFSLPLAIVGAAVGLAVTGRVLGLSAVVGLLMLVGIVVTNAIVLIDRVQTNRKNGMDTRQALVEGGTTRLRPILMTAIATMVALIPLAIGLSEGAIIAAELGTVVIGGLFSSTLLTLVVVPVVFSLFDAAQTAVGKRLGQHKEGTG